MSYFYLYKAVYKAYSYTNIVTNYKINSIGFLSEKLIIIRNGDLLKNTNSSRIMQRLIKLDITCL